MILPGAKMWAGHSCPGSFLLILPLLLTIFVAWPVMLSTKPLVRKLGESKATTTAKSTATAADKSVRPTHGWLSGAAGSGAGQPALARLPGNDAEFFLDGRKTLKHFMQT